MSERRSRYVIAYDIPDDRRRTKIATTLEGYGERVQYSVFECLLGVRQFDALWEELCQLLKPEQDSLRVYRLCAACARWTKAVGQAREVDIPEVYIA